MDIDILMHNCLNGSCVHYDCMERRGEVFQKPKISGVQIKFEEEQREEYERYARVPAVRNKES